MKSKIKTELNRYAAIAHRLKRDERMSDGIRLAATELSIAVLHCQIKLMNEADELLFGHRENG